MCMYKSIMGTNTCTFTCIHACTLLTHRLYTLTCACLDIKQVLKCEGCLFCNDKLIDNRNNNTYR